MGNWYLDLTHLLRFPLNEVLCRRPSKWTSRWCISYNIKYLQCKIGKLDLPIAFFISGSVFWDMKITFLTLLFHFAETETCPLFADTELQSFGLLVSNRGAVIRCQNVRQETTTKADLLYHRPVGQRAPAEWMPLEKKWCSLDVHGELSQRFVFLPRGPVQWDKDFIVTAQHKAANENLELNWEKEGESYSYGNSRISFISLWGFLDESFINTAGT